MSGHDWSEQEVRALVEDYFSMLAMELSGRSYSKTKHRSRLIEILDDRSESSIERKHQNVSAVLREAGLPFIDGYKPLGNYQQLLATVVLERLARSDDLYRLADEVSDSLPTVQDARVLAENALEVSPPEPRREENDWTALRSRLITTPRDYAERDARNRELGRLGEEFVVEVERKRLEKAGRRDLAGKVEWTSRVRGDGAGYDVTSFDAHGNAVFLEVKTTNLGMRFPFIATRNEVTVSELKGQAFRLFRVFRFSKDVGFFVLPGALSQSCRLHPRTFVARF